jgi:hypothetical protein
MQSVRVPGQQVGSEDRPVLKFRRHRADDSQIFVTVPVISKVSMSKASRYPFRLHLPEDGREMSRHHRHLRQDPCRFVIVALRGLLGGGCRGDVPIRQAGSPGAAHRVRGARRPRDQGIPDS